jgi:hypothetical protein
MGEDLEKQLELYSGIIELSHSRIAGVDKDGLITLYN